MDCTESLPLLSEYHDGTLIEELSIRVRTHLAECGPCAGVFQDLDTIVVAASSLRGDTGIFFPDEHAIWQRMSLSRRSIH